MHELFEEQACQQPEAQAVCSWDGNLTYSSLHSFSSKLGHHLRTIGVGPEQIIPFCSEKSLWAIVAAVAILKSGSAFVALDPCTPKSRIASIIQETRAKIIFASPSHATLFQKFSSHVVIISSALIESLQEINGKPCIEVSPQNIATILFTSGSQGKPKGIVLEHRAVCMAPI